MQDGQETITLSALTLLSESLLRLRMLGLFAWVLVIVLPLNKGFLAEGHLLVLGVLPTLIRPPADHARRASDASPPYPLNRTGSHEGVFET